MTGSAFAEYHWYGAARTVSLRRKTKKQWGGPGGERAKGSAMGRSIGGFDEFVLAIVILLLLVSFMIFFRYPRNLQNEFSIITNNDFEGYTRLALDSFFFLLIFQ